ncbi:endonuclease 8-like 3 isoform X2 [Gallus gallus]|uniref:endonuclease 8-like 3 isoform X2 n=1 Tax=Gallus gallus TaxID=9031 RepID=UPI001AE23A9A|nr:endonuclease 8-like 3 isoform X2 [Gallus gallus]
MVEGPCCALFAERLRARVHRGQVVRSARGSALSTEARAATVASEERTSSHDFLTGQVFRGVETLGKELFMYFDQKALRIHFGMNGSMRINPDGRQDRSGALPVLEIQLTEDTICFFEVTAEYRNVTECEQKVRMMENLDVCSPKFSFLRAESEVCQLTDEHIRHLVKMTRDFTLLFYKCRKTGSPLYKHYKVYRRQTCSQCNEKITVCRLGENNRMTYFCSRCQKADPQLVNVSKLPTRNSLIGWACGRGSCSNEHIAQKCEEEWTCMRCTLINKPSAEACDACLTSRPEVSSSLKTENVEDSADFNINLIKYPCNEFRKPSTEIKINRKAAFGNTTLVLTDLGNKAVLKGDIQVSDGCSDYVAPKGNFSHNQSNVYHSVISIDKYCSTDVTSAASSSCQEPLSFKHIKKKQKTHHVPSVHQYNVTIGKPQVNLTDDIHTPSTGPPHCSKHGHLCKLRIVRKDGENKGRMFYSCPLPPETRCNYFQWADLSFPFCHHGKRCVIKMVLKLGPNNGRNFFVCPLQKEKQCGFFQWAENKPVTPSIP